MFDTTSTEARNTNSLQLAHQPPVKYLDARVLFEGAREIRIDHDGQEYRLRQTRNGKLILTK
jgi:hemin uptake protein HemP